MNFSTDAGSNLCVESCRSVSCLYCEWREDVEDKQGFIFQICLGFALMPTCALLKRAFSCILGLSRLGWAPTSFLWLIQLAIWSPSEWDPSLLTNISSKSKSTGFLNISTISTSPTKAFIRLKSSISCQETFLSAETSTFWYSISIKAPLSIHRDASCFSLQCQPSMPPHLTERVKNKSESLKDSRRELFPFQSDPVSSFQLRKTRDPIKFN